MIISSRPPEVIGHFDSSGMSPITDGMNASIEIVVAGSEATLEEESHRRFSQYQTLCDELEPLWNAVDQDFRLSNDLDPTQPVTHAIRIRNDRDVSGRLFAEDQAAGQAAHIDAKVEDVLTTRYATHSTNPTVFLLGERWFLPIVADKLPKQRLLSLAAYTLAKVANGAALAVQSRHGLVYQPRPGEIVKIDGQVHASPERFTRGNKAGKLIVVDSYLPQ